ncbi:hypothetical protein [Actomonas aquatica]|uniref:DUF304 domain-containing protein n=1 Tax=Actomonas aquatica TaxID=2866162 RepID=A0ABZ1C9Z2_9BACT|nr:hypothetical protein [Opitutus sp. WL0086]WRQ87135.1 hypothetical protein K1X11_020170 [Opitutus sp. WL0086]
MKPKCPSCRAEIATADINVASDVALCRKCGRITPASDLLDDVFDPAAVKDPPKGAWLQPTMDGVSMGATTRSPIAFFLVPFMLVWSGGSLGGIYGTQIMKGEFNLMMSLFGLPFLAGSIFFWGLTLMAICGKVEVTINRKLGRVFVGVGRIGWKRNFNLADITGVSEEVSHHRSRRGGTNTTRKIVLEGPQPIHFGSGLSEARRHFLIHALRAAKA